MQNIATIKSELAALPSKIKTTLSPSINPDSQFRPFLKLAEPIYSQPVEPKVPQLDRVANTPYNAQSTSARHESSPRNESQRPARRTEPVSEKPQSSVAESKPRDQNTLDNSKSELPDKAASLKQTNDTARTPSDHSESRERASEKQRVDDAKQASTKADNGKSQASHTEQSSESGSVEISAKPANSDVEAATDSTLNSAEQQKAAATLAQQALPEVDVDWLALVENGKNAQLVDLHLTDTDRAKLKLDLDGAVLPKETDVETLALAVQQLKGEPAQLDELNSTTISSELIGGISTATGKVDSDAAKQLAAVLSDIENLLLQKQQINSPTGSQSLDLKLENAIEQFLQLSLSSEQAQQHAVALLNEQTDLQQLVANSKLVKALDSALVSDLQALQVKADSSQTTKGSNPLVSEQIIEQRDPQLTQVGDATANNSKPVEGALRTLLELSPEKLEKAVNNLAQRLEPKLVSATNADASDSKLDFVAALKSGLEEIKTQIKQGHQPAIDLSSLVADAVAKSQLTSATTEAVNQTVSRFSQALELASTLNARMDSIQVLAGIDKPTSKESIAQNLATAQKQTQQMAQFDKAVNITRQEGVQQLTEKVRWMVSQNNLQADIRLDPPDLGSMKIKVNLSGETASVNIVVQSQQARDVLEQATPRLKELLEQQGIELGQSSVQQESPESGDSSSGSLAQGSESEMQEPESDESVVMEQNIQHGRVGSIDYFV